MKTKSRGKMNIASHPPRTSRIPRFRRTTGGPKANKYAPHQGAKQLAKGKKRVVTDKVMEDFDDLLDIGWLYYH